MSEPTELATPWAVLARALTQRRPVLARYHGRDRLLSPHLLGWKDGRPKCLAYQTDPGAEDPHQRPAQGWRSLFVDELEGAVIAPHRQWATAPDYSPRSNCIDEIVLSLPA